MQMRLSGQGGREKAEEERRGGMDRGGGAEKGGNEAIHSKP